MSALPPKADKPQTCWHVRFVPDCVAKVFLAFGRETLIQDRTRTSNNDSKEPTLRFDCYKFLFHRACLATFATQSAISGHMHCSKQHNAPLAIRRHDRGCISGLLCGVFREQACRVPFLQIRRNRLLLRVGRETCQSPHSLCALARAAWMARFASVTLIEMSFA